MAGKKSRNDLVSCDEWNWFKRSKLSFWLRLDRWTWELGLPLICNIDIDNVEFTIEWHRKMRDGGTESGHSHENYEDIGLLSEDPIYLLSPKGYPRSSDLDRAVQHLEDVTIDDRDFDSKDVIARMKRRRHACMMLSEAHDIFMSNPDHVATNEFEPAYFLDWANKKNIEVPWLGWASENDVLPTASEIGAPQDSEPAQPLKLTTRERNNLLKVIAALCKANSIAYNKRGVAKKIVGLVDDIGENIGEDTVRKILDRIKDILG